MRVSGSSCAFWLVCVVLLSGSHALAGEVRRTFDLPRVEGIDIDGEAGDWEGKGYGFEILLPQYGKHREAENHNASMKLGWTPDGLWFVVWVQDDVWHKKARTNAPIGPDHVDLYLRKARRGEAMLEHHRPVRRLRVHVVPAAVAGPDGRYWICSVASMPSGTRTYAVAFRRPVIGAAHATRRGAGMPASRGRRKPDAMPY